MTGEETPEREPGTTVRAYELMLLAWATAPADPLERIARLVSAAIEQMLEECSTAGALLAAQDYLERIEAEAMAATHRQPPRREKFE